MRFNDSKTKAFIAHKADIILQNGPLDELAGNGWNCFHRLMDIFCKEGPGDMKPINSECVMKALIRRTSDGIRFVNNGCNYTVLMKNAELNPSRHGQRGPCGILLTVPSCGWKYEISRWSPGSNVKSILAIDHFLPELVAQAGKIAMLASIRQSTIQNANHRI